MNEYDTLCYQSFLHTYYDRQSINLACVRSFSKRVFLLTNRREQYGIIYLQRIRR